LIQCDIRLLDSLNNIIRKNWLSVIENLKRYIHVGHGGIQSRRPVDADDLNVTKTIKLRLPHSNSCTEIASLARYTKFANYVRDLVVSGFLPKLQYIELHNVKLERNAQSYICIDKKLTKYIT